MDKVLLVGLGGFLGSVLRYLASGWVHDWTGDRFPFGTLTVNVVGCLAIGLVTYFTEDRPLLTEEHKALIVIGFLGGFTTFSAFGNETLNLWRDGQTFWGLLNVAAQLVLGLGAVWLGRGVGHLIWR